MKHPIGFDCTARTSSVAAALLLCMALTCSITSPAAPLPSGDMQMVQIQEEIPELGPVTLQELRYGTTKIRFRPPPASQTVLRADEKTAYISLNEETRLALYVKVHISTNTTAVLPKEEPLKTGVLAAYPESKILQSVPTMYAGVESRQVDVDYAAANRYGMTARHVFVPFKGGMVEVVLRGTTETFHRKFSLQTQVLNSLQIEQP